jgi:hypothetical protein
LVAILPSGAGIGRSSGEYRIISVDAIPITDEFATTLKSGVCRPWNTGLPLGHGLAPPQAPEFSTMKHQRRGSPSVEAQAIGGQTQPHQSPI